MRLYRNEAPGWAERLFASAAPSVTLRSAVPQHLSRWPFARELAKIRLRALLHWRQTPAWLELLNSHPAFSDYVRNYPKFLYKVYRPYNSHALDADAAPGGDPRPLPLRVPPRPRPDHRARQPGPGGAGGSRRQERPALPDPVAHRQHVRPRRRAGAAIEPRTARRSTRWPSRIAPRDGVAPSTSAASKAARPTMRAKRSASPPATCTASVRSN